MKNERGTCKNEEEVEGKRKKKRDETKRQQNSHLRLP